MPEIQRLEDQAAQQMAGGQFAGAAETYARLCDLVPADLGLRRRLADALRAAGRTGEAIQTYQSVAERYAREGMLLKAVAVNKVILELSPDHQATQAALASLNAAREKRRAAVPPPRRPAPAPAGGWIGPATPGDVPPTPLFSDLDERAFVEILERCKRVCFRSGDLVLLQGDFGRSFYVVSSGAVLVRRTTRDGEVIDLARLAEGAFFGEMALLSEAPRSASVVADGDVELLEFPADVLAALMDHHPSARAAVERFTRQRLLGRVMATSPLFRPLDPEDRRRLIERFLVRPVAAGEVILAAGQEGDGLYVVMQGRFQVHRRLASGGDRLLSELHEGDLFGEISLLLGIPVTAGVTALAPGRLLRLPREDFDELLMTHPEILDLVQRLSEERLQATAAALGGEPVGEAEGLMLV